MSYSQRLADAVRERRLELGLTQKALAGRTARLSPSGKGVAARTITEIESGESRDRHPTTMALLDAALEWPRGTAHRIITDGSDPEPLSEDAPRVEALEAQVQQLALDIADVREAVRGLAALLRLEQSDE